jgi:hypothetical protein
LAEAATFANTGEARSIAEMIAVAFSVAMGRRVSSGCGLGGAGEEVEADRMPPEHPGERHALDDVGAYAAEEPELGCDVPEFPPSIVPTRRAMAV